MVSLKATSPQVLCCAPHLELLLGPTALPSHDLGSQPSKRLAGLAAFIPHMAVFLGRQKLPGILPSHRVSVERGWEGKGRIARRGR